MTVIVYGIISDNPYLVHNIHESTGIYLNQVTDEMVQLNPRYFLVVTVTLGVDICMISISHTDTKSYVLFIFWY